MILRTLIFDPEIVEERLRAGVMSYHEQQASEPGNEQQPHELWPAYYVTLVREQASSLVLFQQQRDITSIETSCACCSDMRILCELSMDRQSSARPRRLRI